MGWVWSWEFPCPSFVAVGPKFCHCCVSPWNVVFHGNVDLISGNYFCFDLVGDCRSEIDNLIIPRSNACNNLISDCGSKTDNLIIPRSNIYIRSKIITTIVHGKPLPLLSYKMPCWAQGTASSILDEMGSSWNWSWWRRRHRYRGLKCLVSPSRERRPPSLMGGVCCCRSWECRHFNFWCGFVAWHPFPREYGSQFLWE